MKKILLTLLMVSFAASAFAGLAPGTGVVGSKHDMRVLTGSTEERVCAYCHTPHHANVVEYDYMPLWSHETTAYPEASFTPYASDTFSQSGAVDTMIGPSMLCMSCHDGAVAPDAYYGQPGNVTPEGDVWNGYGVGEFAEMKNDHPIGFDYDLAAAANAVGTSNDPVIDADDPVGAGYGIAYVNEVLFVDSNGDRWMTCATCHDVHNSSNLVVEDYFLYGSQVDSAFCTMCHLQK